MMDLNRESKSRITELVNEDPVVGGGGHGPLWIHLAVSYCNILQQFLRVDVVR